MSNNTQFANREVCDLTFCDYKTQKPIHHLDYANVTTQEITGEAVFAYGGQGHPKKVTFHGDTGGTLTVEVQIMTAELFSIMTGASIASTASFLKHLVLTAEDEKLTLPDDVTLTESSIQVLDSGGKDVTVTIAGKVITLPANSTGDFSVYGIESLTTGVKKLSITSTTFPKSVTIYGETVMKGEDDSLYPYKFIAYKATPQKNFSLALSSSGDPTTLTLVFDLLENDDHDLMDMILIES